MSALAAGALEREVDRELRVVDSAVALVKQGVANRVTVANLPLGAEVLNAARARAALHRCRITEVWTTGGAPPALVVEAGEAEAAPDAEGRPAPTAASQSTDASRTRYPTPGSATNRSRALPPGSAAASLRRRRDTYTWR